MAQIISTAQSKARLGTRLTATSHSHAWLWQQPVCLLHALCGVLALRAPASPVLQKAFPSTWSPISVHIRSKGLKKARHTSQRSTGIIYKARTIPGQSEAFCSHASYSAPSLLSRRQTTTFTMHAVLKDQEYNHMSNAAYWTTRPVLVTKRTIEIGNCCC